MPPVSTWGRGPGTQAPDTIHACRIHCYANTLPAVTVHEALEISRVCRRQGFFSCSRRNTRSPQRAIAVPLTGLPCPLLRRRLCRHIINCARWNCLLCVASAEPGGGGGMPRDYDRECEAGRQRTATTNLRRDAVKPAGGPITITPHNLTGQSRAGEL